jgi:predicted MFS family arabinose efflux permease
MVMAPMYSYVTAARGRWSVAQVLTLIVAGYYCGAIFSPTLGGIIAERFGFRAVYWAGLVFFVLSTLLIVNIRPQPVERSETTGNGSGLIKNQVFIGFMLVLFLVIFAAYLPQPLSPNFLQNQRDLNLRQIGLLYSATNLGIVTANLALGRLESRTGFIAGQAAVVTFVLLLWKGSGLPWYILAYFLLGGFRATRALASAQVRSLVKPGEMGLAYALVETISGVATILAPILAGRLYSLNPEWMYSIGAGLILLGILASAFMLPARTQNLEDISPA